VDKINKEKIEQIKKQIEEVSVDKSEQEQQV